MIFYCFCLSLYPPTQLSHLSSIAGTKPSSLTFISLRSNHPTTLSTQPPPTHICLSPLSTIGLYCPITRSPWFLPLSPNLYFFNITCIMDSRLHSILILHINSLRLNNHFLHLPRMLPIIHLYLLYRLKYLTHHHTFFLSTITSSLHLLIFLHHGLYTLMTLLIISKLFLL